MSKIVHVINVRPDFSIFNTDFTHKKHSYELLKKELKSKGRLQDKSFRLIVTPLNHREYKQYSANRYEANTIIKVFNEHLKIHPDDERQVNIAYIIKRKSLLKRIMDVFFEISGGQTEHINNQPKYMFDILEKYRRSYSTPESLLDRLVINTALAMGDMSAYRMYHKLPTLDERLGFVALLELATGISIKERYTMAMQFGTAIDLTNDSRTFNKQTGQNARNRDKAANQVDELASEASMALQEAYRRESRLRDLGVQVPINTERENASLRELDS